MRTISFIAQLDNETDKDRCRYVLATLDAGKLDARLKALGALRKADPGVHALVFADGFVEVHVTDATFPVDYREVPEGEACPLTEDEQSAFDAEGWSPVPASAVSAVPVAYSGFMDSVYDPRIVVSELGLQIWASWALDSGEAIVRSWTVGWEIMDSAVKAA